MAHPNQPLDNLQLLIKDALDRQAAEQGGPIAQVIAALTPLATLFFVHLLYLGIRYLSRVERRLHSHSHSRYRSLSPRR